MYVDWLNGNSKRVVFIREGLMRNTDAVIQMLNDVTRISPPRNISNDVENILQQDEGITFVSKYNEILELMEASIEISLQLRDMLEERIDNNDEQSPIG